MKILIVDDDATTSLLIRQQLKDIALDENIKDCTSLSNVQKEISTFHPDLILLDCTLGDSSKEETIATISSINTGSAVVVLTGFATVELATAAIRSGADDFVSKDILSDRNKFILCINKAWSSFKNRLSKEKQTSRTEALGDHFIKTEHSNMTIGRLDDFMTYVKVELATLPELRQNVNTMYQTIYEGNGKPSIKETVAIMEQNIGILLKRSDEDAEEKEKRKEEETKAATDRANTNRAGRWGIYAATFTIVLGSIIEFFSKLKN